MGYPLLQNLMRMANRSGCWGEEALATTEEDKLQMVFRHMESKESKQGINNKTGRICGNQELGYAEVCNQP